MPSNIPCTVVENAFSLMNPLPESNVWVYVSKKTQKPKPIPVLTDVFRSIMKKIRAWVSNLYLYDVPMLEFFKYLHYPALCYSDVEKTKETVRTLPTQKQALFLTRQLVPCNSMNSHMVGTLTQYVFMECWISSSYFHGKQLHHFKKVLI